MRCQRHLLCPLVQLWLKFYYGPEPGGLLGWKCCTKYAIKSDVPEDDPREDSDCGW